MKTIVAKILKILTYRVLEKQKPSVITITGSVGKTSTKEGVYFAIKGLGNVRRSLKNYNNELGVPFTVALWSDKAPGKNLMRWLKVFYLLSKLACCRDSNYPKFLVLEIGSDKPGDLQYLMEMMPNGLLKCVVLTAVFGVHLEFFKSIEVVYQEKITPFKYVADDGLIVVNADNCDIERIKKDFAGKKIISYGFEKPADIMAVDFKAGERGLNFNIKTPKDNFNFLLKQAISAYQSYPVLAGVAVAMSMGVDVKEALVNLEAREPLVGRMRLLDGKNNSLIIDDTYNSSPEAVKYALKALKDLPRAGRKIAVLADMLELGENADVFHREIGKFAVELGIDYLITLGELSKFTTNEASKFGMALSNNLHFETQEQVISCLNNLIKSNDVLLVKGSQGMRMERVVKAIMAESGKAKELLVRQGEEWA